MAREMEGECSFASLRSLSNHLLDPLNSIFPPRLACRPHPLNLQTLFVKSPHRHVKIWPPFLLRLIIIPFLPMKSEMRPAPPTERSIYTFRTTESLQIRLVFQILRWNQYFQGW